MSDYHLNIFRPYGDPRNEMSMTRALVVAFARAQNGKKFQQAVLSKAGITTEEVNKPTEYGLEVCGNVSKQYEVKIKAVLCIAPSNERVERGPFSSILASPSALGRLSEIVKQDASVPSTEKLKPILVEIQPELQAFFGNKNVDELSALLNEAWWDSWRLLYAGARADAIIRTEDMLILVESKIWGNVYEVQAHNHAQEFFGSTNIPIRLVSWQDIYDIALGFDDTVISDFRDYLVEFPQLVEQDHLRFDRRFN